MIIFFFIYLNIVRTIYYIINYTMYNCSHYKGEYFKLNNFFINLKQELKMACSERKKRLPEIYEPYKKELVRQYNRDNKEKIKQYNRDNKERIYKQSNERRLNNVTTCECGSTYRSDGKHKHIKTKKHLKFFS